MTKILIVLTGGTIGSETKNNVIKTDFGSVYKNILAIYSQLCKSTVIIQAVKTLTC